MEQAITILNYLPPKCVSFLSAKTKDEALAELCGLLSAGDVGATAERLLAEVQKREKLMSTGIGQGLAIPHARLGEVRQPGIAVGISPGGISGYDSLDAEPITILVLIVAPQGQHEVYIRLLAKMVEILKQPEMRKRILAAESAAVAHALLSGQQVGPDR